MLRMERYVAVNPRRLKTLNCKVKFTKKTSTVYIPPAAIRTIVSSGLNLDDSIWHTEFHIGDVKGDIAVGIKFLAKRTDQSRILSRANYAGVIKSAPFFRECLRFLLEDITHCSYTWNTEEQVLLIPIK